MPLGLHRNKSAFVFGTNKDLDVQRGGEVEQET